MDRLLQVMPSTQARKEANQRYNDRLAFILRHRHAVRGLTAKVVEKLNCDPRRAGSVLRATTRDPVILNAFYDVLFDHLSPQLMFFYLVRLPEATPALSDAEYAAAQADAKEQPS